MCLERSSFGFEALTYIKVNVNVEGTDRNPIVEGSLEENKGLHKGFHLFEDPFGKILDH